MGPSLLGQLDGHMPHPTCSSLDQDGLSWSDVFWVQGLYTWIHPLKLAVQVDH